MKSAIMILALLAATEADAADPIRPNAACSLSGQVVSPVTGLCFTSEKDGEPPTSYRGTTNTVPGLSILDLNAPSALMMCYMEGFNERRLCALLGDTPGCVKWLAAHPDPNKNKFQ